MASPTIPLSSVTERSIKFTVVLTLQSIKASKKSTRGDQTLQNLLFTDIEGNEMIATIFQEHISSFRNSLHEGHQYEIQNPIVNVIPEKFRYENQMYQMVFEKGLHIIDLGQTETTKNFWVPVNSVDENLQRRDRIDLVAVAIFVRPLRKTRNRATSDENEARDIIIVDHQ
ncbi:replication protein A 70 kDa DNA-binding subunit D-like [Silene latifolia]|uniref:replication protein A 70 kDa DNA-binding subunit D-like n=1 Tax=Silene latifolia TaxID=37657 RepID=UPI003D775F0B